MSETPTRATQSLCLMTRAMTGTLRLTIVSERELLMRSNGGCKRPGVCSGAVSLHGRQRPRLVAERTRAMHFCKQAVRA